MISDFLCSYAKLGSLQACVQWLVQIYVHDDWFEHMRQCSTRNHLFLNPVFKVSNVTLALQI